MHMPKVVLYCVGWFSAKSLSLQLEALSKPSLLQRANAIHYRQKKLTDDQESAIATVVLTDIQRRGAACANLTSTQIRQRIS